MLKIWNPNQKDWTGEFYAIRGIVKDKNIESNPLLNLLRNILREYEQRALQGIT